MKFFLLKKPASLNFIPTPFAKDERVPNQLQVRNYDSKSNSSLVRLKNGEWYVRNGKFFFKLKPLPTMNSKLAKTKGKSGEFLADFDSKFFLSRL